MEQLLTHPLPRVREFVKRAIEMKFDFEIEGDDEEVKFREGYLEITIYDEGIALSEYTSGFHILHDLDFDWDVDLNLFLKLYLSYRELIKSKGE